MAYTQTFYVDTNKGSDTIGDGSASSPYKTITYTKTKITTTSPIIYLADGIYNMYDIVSLSMSGKTITYESIFKDATIKFDNCSLPPVLGGTGFLGPIICNKITFQPNDVYGGDSRFLHYATESVSIIFNNCVFLKSSNGSYPTQWFFTFDTSNGYYSNKVFNYCLFDKTPSNTVSGNYGKYVNCVTKNAKYNSNTNATYQISSLVNCTFDTNLRGTNFDNDIYGLYAGLYKWRILKALLFKDTSYYNILASNYDVLTNKFIPLYKSDVNQTMLDFFKNNSFKLSNISDDLLLGDVYKKPMNVFDKPYKILKFDFK